MRSSLGWNFWKYLQKNGFRQLNICEKLMDTGEATDIMKTYKKWTRFYNKWKVASE